MTWVSIPIWNCYLLKLKVTKCLPAGPLEHDGDRQLSSKHWVSFTETFQIGNWLSWSSVPHECGRSQAQSPTTHINESIWEFQLIKQMKLKVHYACVLCFLSKGAHPTLLSTHQESPLPMGHHLRGTSNSQSKRITEYRILNSHLVAFILGRWQF